MGLGKTYSTKYLADSNNNTGSANQVLISTPSGIDWVDGSGSSIIGGPYLPLTAGSSYPLTDNLFIRGDDKGLVVQNAASTTNVTVGAVSSSAVSTGFITLRHLGVTKIVLNANDNSYFTGNVGIGTTNPGYNLDVNGDIRIPQNEYIFFDNTAHYIRRGSSNVELQGYNGLELKTENFTRLLINQAGNVGIGLLNPAKTLDVFGTGRFYDDLSLSENLRMDNRQTGAASSSQPRISRAVLESSIETGNAVVHPYFNNDLANFAARGGTVIVGGVTTQPSSAAKNIIFQPSNQFMSISDSTVTGSTWSITLLSSGDAAFNLTYGCYIGITFGSGSFDPDSMIIEGTTDATGATGWTTALNSSVSSTTYSTYLSSSGTGIKAIRFTMGYTSGSVRVNNIFAYNYTSKGMTDYFLGKHGGKIYGNIETTSFGSSAAVNLINNSGSSYFNGGNVGIGTTNPRKKLHVSHSDNNNGLLLENTNNVNNYQILQNIRENEGLIWQRWIDGSFNSNLMTLDYDGNVGIGTTVPTAKLHLEGDAIIEGVLRADNVSLGLGGAIKLKASNTASDQYIAFGTTPSGSNGNATFTEKMRITSGGDVGIGTDDPSTNLEVSSSGAEGILISKDTGTTSNSGRLFFETDTVSEGFSFLNSNGFMTIRSQAEAGVTSGNTRVAIDGSGKVGIGTTNPLEKLTVDDGAGRFTSANSADGTYFVLKAQGSGGALNNAVGITFDSEGRSATYNNRNKTAIVGESIGWSRNKLHFLQNNVTDTTAATLADSVMTIDTNGNVGIGTTSPYSKLDVNSGISSSSIDVIKLSQATTGAVKAAASLGLSIQNGGEATNAADLWFTTASGGTTSERMRITSGGELIINGTTSTYGVSQGYPLHVKGTASQGYVSICRGTQNSGSEGLIVGTDSSNAYLLSRDNIPLILGSNNLSHVFIKPSGNVGIGTNNPTPKMHLVYTGGTYSTDATSGFINQADTGRATMRLRSIQDEASELFFDIDGGIRWDISARSSAQGHSLNFYPQAANPSYSSVSSHTFQLSQNGDVIVTGSGSSGKMGIGTTSPGSKLHIDSTGEALRFTRSSQETYRVIHGSSGLYFTGPNTASLVLGVTQNSDVDIFNTSGSVMFRADGSSGNVGIGTTTPDEKLEVSGSFKIGNIKIQDTGTGRIGFNRNTSTGAIYNSNYSAYQINGPTTSTGSLDIQSYSSTGSYLGVVSINSGNVTANNFILSSDKTLKENVKDLDVKVDAKWRSYKFKDSEETRYGVIAQELEETNPELVRTNDEGLKSVAYVDLLIAKIAELEARLEKLEK